MKDTELVGRGIMCGICGYISKREIDLQQLIAMNDTMYHRGPDDCGAEIFEGNSGYSLGLAQRRLSILDLSELGHQPMYSSDKRVSLVFNGEIYNYMELRSGLNEYDFISSCDTEVIIAAYLKWGISCINRLNGMFAIALYDKKSDTLFLVRDRMGEKPLYYWLDNDNIVFASECKAIMQYPGFKKEVNIKVLKKYLCNEYINSPETIFENVFQLEPGCILSFHGGDINKNKYWDVIEMYHQKSVNLITNFDEAKSQLSLILTDAVKKRMISDVPLGTFLSGGFDSTLVAAIAQSMSQKPIKTFTIGFDSAEYNEAIYAKEVAAYLGTAHTELYISEQDMLDLVETIPEFYDEPFADPSEIPTMLVSMLAKRDVTVALSGDGGDELFCGYQRYIRVKQAQQLDFAGALVNGICNIPILRQMDILNKIPNRVKTIALNREKSKRCQIHITNSVGIVNQMLPDSSEDCKYDESRYYHKDWQQECMLLDQETYLPSLLCKMDRASMKYSLECRCPLLDYRVVELSYQIPHVFKYTSNSGGKRILKELTYNYVPKRIMDRPKHGFGAPVEKWLKGVLKESLLEYSEEKYLRKQGIFEPSYTNRFIQAYIDNSGANLTNVVWSFFIFQKWYQYYIN